MSGLCFWKRKLKGCSMGGVGRGAPGGAEGAAVREGPHAGGQRRGWESRRLAAEGVTGRLEPSVCSRCHSDGSVEAARYGECRARFNGADGHGAQSLTISLLDSSYCKTFC